MSNDMPEISASLVKELRDRTGAGWMECKRALVETNGDLDEAERVIREKGLAAAKKRAGRTTPEGKVLARIDENIEVVGAARLEAESGEVLAAYVHPPAEKIGVLVRALATPELARLVAMHISFASPRFVTRSEVPSDEVEAERAILSKLPDLEGKPDEVREKMIEGRLAKGLFAETVLDDQPWIHDPDRTVGEALAEHGAEVREFVRYALTQ